MIINRTLLDPSDEICLGDFFLGEEQVTDIEAKITDSDRRGYWKIILPLVPYLEGVCYTDYKVIYYK